MTPAAQLVQLLTDARRTGATFPDAWPAAVTRALAGAEADGPDGWLEALEERDAQPLPAGVSPHKLRHTFASILVALGNDPSYVMAQLGHTDPAFTLRVYTHMMRRDAGERDRLRALVGGADWAPLGTSAPAEPARGARAGRPVNDETPAVAGVPRYRGARI